MTSEGPRRGGIKLDFQKLPAQRLLVTFFLVNVALCALTAFFVQQWAGLEERSPQAVTFVSYVLVQFHLGTENVFAAWYASMLLLGVAVLAGIAFIADRQRPPLVVGSGRLRVRLHLRWGWAMMSAVFLLLSLDELGSIHERLSLLTTSVAVGEGRSWMSILAVPIGGVALFLLGFAWFHLRRVRMSLWLLAGGVLLFVSIPFLEMNEMAGLQAGAPSSILRLLLEEGFELTGTLLFGAAVLVYLRAHDPQPVIIPAPKSPGMTFMAVAAVWLAALALLHNATYWYPRGANGIVENWFAASALTLTGLVALAARQRNKKQGARRGPFGWLAVLAFALSGWFGAALHDYETWKSFEAVKEVLVACLIVYGTVAVVLCSSRDTRVAKVPGVVGAILLGIALNAYSPAYATAAAVLGAWLTAASIGRVAFYPFKTARACIAPPALLSLQGSGRP